MSEALASITPPKVAYDGFSALDGGVDGRENRSVSSAGNPNGLARNQASFAVNSTFRGGSWTHRPVYMRRPLQFIDLGTAVAFSSGLMQGYAVHESTTSSLIVSVSGRIYQVSADDYTVRDITPAKGTNPANQDYAWFLQAGPFTVIQDGSSRPLIFDGTSVRESALDEIKPGGSMAFSQGRIWYAVKDIFGRFTRFRATDLIGGPLGTPQYQQQDSVLKETENTFLNEGGDFSARSDMGEIRSMVVPRMLDTSLGQGPLQVFCVKGAMSVNAPVDRTTWKDVTYPILTESNFDYGALGGCFASNANGDILYRSLDGFRSFKLSRADFQQWLNTGISSEVDNIIDGDPDAFLFYGSSLVFDNRYLATTWPRPTTTGFVHDGIVALDFNLITSLRQRAPAAWEGVWTGIAAYRLVKGTFDSVERCFTFARNKDGLTELWEILASTSDEIWDNADTPIVWSAETPSYDFNEPQNLKRLQTAAIFREDIQENVRIDYEFRPDQHPCFIPWHTEYECAPVKQCVIPRCGTPKNLKPQYRPKVRLPQPPDDCNLSTGTLYRDFYECAFRIQIVGHMKVKTFRVAAFERFEPFFDGCPMIQPCNELEGCCSPDPLLYSSAPYHDSGSDGGYPYPIYPGYPSDYPTASCPDCNTVNPPPGTPGVVPPIPPTPVGPPTPAPPRKVQFPGLPPVYLLPQPDPPTLVGSAIYFGLWDALTPGGVNPGPWDIGMPTEPPDGLEDGVYELWATQLWTKFSDFAATYHLTITQAQIIKYYSGPQLGPGASRRFFPNQYLAHDNDITSFGLGFGLAIVYLTS